MDFKFTPRTPVKFIVGHSTRFVVSALVSSIIVEPDNKKDRARLFLGTYAISHLVADKVTDWVDSEIDEYIEIFQECKEFFQGIKEIEQAEQVHVVTDVPAT